MIEEEIIKMAKQAGFYMYDMHDVDGEDLGESVEADSYEVLTRFARLVAAREREACALVCDDFSQRGSNHAYIMAKAIRAGIKQ